MPESSIFFKDILEKFISAVCDMLFTVLTVYVRSGHATGCATIT